MSDGLLSLSWNNHKATFCHILSTLRDKGRYTDVTLACDGKFYPVHKLVLSTCSEYFESMFEQTPCKHPIIVLKDIKSDEVESLLSYMYAGVVNVAQNDLARLIKAAELLKVKGLAVPDEPPPESEPPKKSHAPPWSSHDDRSSPHPKRRRREEPEISLGESHHSGSPPSSPRTSPFHPAGDFHQENTRTPNELQTSESRIDRVLDRLEPDSKTDQNSDSQPTKQASPLHQSIPDETLVKEEILDPIDGSQDDIMNSGIDYGSMDSRLENSTGDGSGGGADHNQFQPNKFEPPHLSDAVVEALAGPSGMQGWLGSGGDLGGGGGFGGVEGYSTGAAGEGLRQTLSTQQQPHQMIGVEGGGGRKEAPVPTFIPPTTTTTTTTATKIHHCHFCSYSSPKKFNLDNHMRIHTGEKPFPCPHCPYSASTKETLKRHILVHTGEKPYACRYCPYRCTQWGSLKSHMIYRHSINKKNYSP